MAGRYRLEGLLGSGGMGEVHRAWDVHLRRYVALKLFPATADAVARQRFDTEIHLMAQLSHPNLVSVYDAGDSAGLSFVALQLVDGPTLREQLAAGPLDPGQVRALGADLCDALTHVHSHGVVHRDVKPANILLDMDGMPYLADFGLARLTGSTRLTKCDEMVGTAAYLAPEQVRGDEVGPPADIYALGLVLLECLTGQREYEGNEIEAAVARLHRPPLVPDTLPEDLVRLLSLMTSLTPHRRPDAAQCAAALRGAELPVVDDGPVTAVVPRPRAAKRFLVAAAIGALAVTGVSLATLGGSPPAVSEPTTPSPIPQPPAVPQQAVVTHTTTVVVPAPTQRQQPKPTATPTKKANTGSGNTNSGNSGPGNSENGNSENGKSKGKKPEPPGRDD